MNEERLGTIEQVEEVLSGSAAIEFSATGDDSERYGHISRVLKRLPTLGVASASVGCSSGTWDKPAATRSRMLENHSETLSLDDAIAVEYSEATHGFFPELARMTITLSALGIAFDLHGKGMARPYDLSQAMVLEGKRDVSGLKIHFFPALLYQRLLSPTGRQPRFMKVIKMPVNQYPTTHPIKLTNLQQLMARVVGDAFVSYYERHLAAVISIWDKEPKGRWPPIWRFGWALRNAFAHNGRIHFTHNNRPDVRWRNLNFNYDDNGRQVLFDEITGVELILLMEDMDSVLQGLGNRECGQGKRPLGSSKSRADLRPGTFA